MSKLNLLGLEFIIVSIVLSVILYKLKISKRIIDEDYEYINDEDYEYINSDFFI